MLHVAQYSHPAVVNVFLDSDALIALTSQITAFTHDVYFAKEMHGWWKGQCKLANYSVCLNTGVVIFKATRHTAALFHKWWAQRTV